jgi:hypothetical protein
VDVALSLNMSVAGIVAHESAKKGGELLEIPLVEDVRFSSAGRADGRRVVNRLRSAGDGVCYAGRSRFRWDIRGGARLRRPVRQHPSSSKP